MRFVIQRVKEAKVKVGDDIVGSIGKGLLVFIGLTHSDKTSDIEFAANKLLNLRLWDDEKGVRWKECVKSLNLEILIVSQFTLYSFMKGNKPDFHYALEPEPAEKMYDNFVETLKKNYIKDKIQTGRFGQLMEVSLVNDGPVTINWEYPEIKSDAKNEVKSEAISKVKNNTDKKLKNQPLNDNNDDNKNNLNSISNDDLIDTETNTKI